MPWTEARVSAWRHWDQGLSTLTISAEGVPDFAAGQFFQLGLDLGGERIRRSYSVASAPGSPLEFYLTEVEGGALSPALFRLQPGETLLLENTARGFFTLDHVPRTRRGWFISTGTGLGPFISMLRDGRTWNHFEEIVLVHGVRYAKQLAYSDELEYFADAKRLRYLPVTSREGASGCLHGRVTSLLGSGDLEQAAGAPLDREQDHLLLCGNPEMITDMMALLAEREFARHRVRKPGQVTFEKYW